MMHNRDLLAYIKPVSSRYSQAERVELLDLTGQVTDIESNRFWLTIRFQALAGIFRMYLRTRAGAFDMATASIGMVRAPDGKRVSLGPWDLDHIHNVMALPMARVFVNGALKGGLWFAMPGPEEIAAGRLFADFGFETVSGTNELVLELIERDRDRMGWDRIEFAEIRQDDRRCVELLPQSKAKPRLFATRQEATECAKRWSGRAEFQALGAALRQDKLVLLTDNSQGTLSLAMMYYAITGDVEVGQRARAAVMELASATTWSGRPDPLLMGGENDKGISVRLFHVALAWEHLTPLLTAEDHDMLKSKAEEYIRKIYDFTLLQRAYMGYPAIDPHALGSWNGVAIACMAFYDELPIARHALPFFHGLLMDSLQLFPESGKAAWATYFPFHMVLYLAAACSFAGPLEEVEKSPFLHNLGSALLTSFASPNSQELQRGLRTREHRFLTAFLYRLHSTPEIAAIYRAFFQQELQAAGDVSLGIFDLLYAPEWDGPAAAMPHDVLYARDIGDVIANSESQPQLSVSMSAGAKAGKHASFTLMPQNREFAPSMGAFEVAVDGAPVLININISCYGIQSALTNTICLEDGGGVTNGQYLNGAVRPDQCSVMRRYLSGKRFVCSNVVMTHAMDPKLDLEAVDRLFVFDRHTGIIVVTDSFTANHALRFATHLHCAGSVSKIEDDLYRLTGGQADRIAGIKGGSKGLGDEEKGELYARVLRSSSATRVVTEEPTWIPGYIYGINHTGEEKLSDARFPRYTRWRLELQDRTTSGEMMFALSPRPDMVTIVEDSIQLPGGGMQVGLGQHEIWGAQLTCECLLWDDTAECVTALGVSQLAHEGRSVVFDPPVDLEYIVSQRQGRIFASSTPRVSLTGFVMGGWDEGNTQASHGRLSANLQTTV